MLGAMLYPSGVQLAYSLFPRVADWGHEMGLKQGSVVALNMQNRPEFMITWLGLAKVIQTIQPCFDFLLFFAFLWFFFVM